MALSLYEITESLLDCACEALATQETPWEGFCCIYPGTVSLDSCCESGGQAWARVLRTYPTTSFPRSDEATEQTNCHSVSWATQLELGVVRCVCYDLCDCEVSSQNAQLVMGDADALLRGVLCCLADGACSDVEYRVQSQQPFGPQGGCAGSVLTVVVLRYICC